MLKSIHLNDGLGTDVSSFHKYQPLSSTFNPDVLRDLRLSQRREMASFYDPGDKKGDDGPVKLQGRFTDLINYP